MYVRRCNFQNSLQFFSSVIIFESCLLHSLSDLKDMADVSEKLKRLSSLTERMAQDFFNVKNFCDNKQSNPTEDSDNLLSKIDNQIDQIDVDSTEKYNSGSIDIEFQKLAESDSSDSAKSKTFVFSDEGHTLGNALRCLISSYPDVQFCGYTVPHPAEAKMHFRIQMYHGKAIDALKQGLEDLVNVCDVTLEKFDEELKAC